MIGRTSAWTTLRRVTGLIVLSISLVILGWGGWPEKTVSHSLKLAAADFGPGVNEARQVRIDWPAVMRLGDEYTMRVMLDPLPDETAAGGAQAPVLIESRLEIAGLNISPPGTVTQLMQPGKSLVLRYSITPRWEGRFPGTLWLHRLSSTEESSGDQSWVLTAQPLELQAGSLFGLGAPYARALGGAGIVIGIALGLDGAAAWLWRKLEARSAHE